MDFTENIEPDMNSYDVSFILSIFKPHWNTGITREELRKLIPFRRREMLLKWAQDHTNHLWLVDKAFL